MTVRPSPPVQLRARRVGDAVAGLATGIELDQLERHLADSAAHPSLRLDPVAVPARLPPKWASAIFQIGLICQVPGPS